MSSGPRHILHVFATFVAAGPQTRTTALMNALGGEYRHTVLAMDGRAEAAALVDSSVQLELVDPPPAASFFKTLKALLARIDAARPDLICTYNWGSIETLMAAPRGIPLVHHEEGFGPEEADGFKRRRVWTRRFVLRRVDHLVVPSHLLEDVARKRWKVKDERLHVIPNGVHLERFAPNAAATSALRAELGIPDGAFIVGSVGHLRAEKNYARLLRAAQLAATEAPSPGPDWHVALVGDGPERASLEELARTLPQITIHFAGHRTDCAPFYDLMDVFALSSDTEQMPISLVEAMATGTPAACTDVGDIARMLPAHHACFISPLSEDAKGLADRLGQFHADPALRQRAANEVRDRAHEHYAFERMLTSYAALWATAR